MLKMPKKMTSSKNNSFEPIAVIGVGALFPGSDGATGFWRDIINGKDLVTDILPSHWLIKDYYDPDFGAMDKTYCKRGAFLNYVDFDPVEYGIPPNVIPATDTSQLLSLIVAKQVLSDATDGKYSEIDLSRVSVILGAAALEALQYVAARLQKPVWEKALRDFGLSEPALKEISNKISNSYVPWQENTFPGLLGNVIAGRIANRFNLGGTNCITDAACAGSLAALAMAVNELQQGTADMVITGGVDTLNDIVMFMCFSKTQALSRAGDCRPFSDKADGTILGEGIGMFALKRLSDAEINGDQIYAVIKGIGTSSDGRSKSIYAPVAAGQSNAILRAYDIAGFDPATVEMIEAHGTGTKAGDLAEFDGLNLAFTARNKNHKKQYCALGSVKSQIGHTKSAAGSAGLFKAIMALHHKILPPTIKVDKPNPQMDMDNSPFYLNTELRPWIRDRNHPRRAGVSSFGFGGSNYHVALEEYTGLHKKAHKLRIAPTELVLLSAENPQQLLLQARKLLDERNTIINLSALARSSQEKTDPKNLARLAIVATDINDLFEKITQILPIIESAPDKPSLAIKGIYYGFALDAGKVAFMFPGQGSQYLKMGGDLAMTFSSIMNLWNELNSEIIDEDVKLHDVIFPVPGFSAQQREEQTQRLTATKWAQPALAITSLAQLKVLQSLGIKPDCVAGHSFGELTALYAAGAMDAHTFLQMARKRGELIQIAAANTPGAMLSVNYAADDVLALLKKFNLMVMPANFNSPTQVVLSGTIDAIAEAERCFQQQNIQCQRLLVSSAFHSNIVKTASQPFKKYLQKITFNSLKVPTYSDSTADLYPENPKLIPDYLSEQLINPVRFQQIIENMYTAGVRTFIEVGPSAVLTGLVKQCLTTRDCQVINLDKKGEHGLTRLWDALGKLFVAGMNPNFAILWEEYSKMLPVENNKTNKFTVKLNGTNYGKPYPLSCDIDSHVSELPSIEAKAVLSSNQAHVERSKVLTKLISHSKGKTMSENFYLQSLIASHQTYLETMANSHTAFLNLVSQLSGGGMVMPISLPEQKTVPEMVMPIPAASMAPPPVTMQAVMNPAPPAHVQSSLQNITQSAPVVAAPAIIKQTIPGAKNTHGHDLESLVMEIVVEKTGYPLEMLSMDMAIEADLGIDSIKRVEILSHLAEREPNLPEIGPSDLAELLTLGDIVAYLQRHRPKTNGIAGHA